MNRSKLNLLVDLASGFSFVGLTSTGFLLQWKLPPGSGRVAGPEGPDNPVTLLWGWDRHEWGDFHFILGLVFLGLLSLHVGLHWRWLVAMMKGKPREPSSEPRALAGLLGLALLLASVLPLWGQTEVRTRGEVRQDRGEVPIASPPDSGKNSEGMAGQQLYSANCLSCHGEPAKLPPLGLDWTAKRLSQTPPARPHQNLSLKELEQVISYVRAAQLSAGN